MLDLTFIGDRPAEICALVLDADPTYTGDKLDPFQVQRMVERYMDDQLERNKRAYLTHRRTIVLSTGLTWRPRYVGMATKQCNTLLHEAFVTPKIYVMPVSSRILLGHTINTRLEAMCSSTQMRREHTNFLGRYVSARFSGNTAYPTHPTPVEVLRILEELRLLQPI